MIVYILMRSLQEASMIQKVHRNVKYMLSQARSIVKYKQKLPSIVKSNFNYLDQISSIPVDHSINQQRSKQSERQSFDRYNQFKAKQRPFSLILDRKKRASVLRKSSNNYIQNQQKDKQQNNQLLEPVSILSNDQNELIQKKNCLKKQKKRLKTLLPSIFINKTREKHQTQVTGQYCLTIPIQVLEKIAEIKLKKTKANDGISSINLLSYLQKNKQKIHPFQKKPKKREKSNSGSILDNHIDLYEPWQSEGEQADLYF